MRKTQPCRSQSRLALPSRCRPRQNLPTKQPNCRSLALSSQNDMLYLFMWSFIQLQWKQKKATSFILIIWLDEPKDKGSQSRKIFVLTRCGQNGSARRPDESSSLFETNCFVSTPFIPLKCPFYALLGRPTGLTTFNATEQVAKENNTRIEANPLSPPIPILWFSLPASVARLHQHLNIQCILNGTFKTHSLSFDPVSALVQSI